MPRSSSTCCGRLGPAPRPRPRVPHDEMARLVRLEWRARVDAQGLRRELRRGEVALEASRRETAAAVARTEEVRRNYESTLSWRATSALRWARDFVRRALGRG